MNTGSKGRPAMIQPWQQEHDLAARDVLARHSHSTIQSTSGRWVCCGILGACHAGPLWGWGRPRGATGVLLEGRPPGRAYIHDIQTDTPIFLHFGTATGHSTGSEVRKQERPSKH